jgi:hypothetical protein
MARLYGNGALIMSTPTEARGLACPNFVPRSEYDVSLESCNLAVEYNQPIATRERRPARDPCSIIDSRRKDELDEMIGF